VVACNAITIATPRANFCQERCVDPHAFSRLGWRPTATAGASIKLLRFLVRHGNELKTGVVEGVKKEPNEQTVTALGKQLELNLT
jgi:hypothetical protein